MADINGDGVIDMVDVGLVIADYGDCESDCATDLNGDGMVDAADVGLVLALYGVCDG